MKTPTVSVVMSVFNGQAFLVEAIESILGQTFRNLEFVIVDDGSTDSTPKILNTFAKQDERIRILRHANKGRAESLNVGIGLAKGKYIARMDADDVALPNRLQEQVDFMECHPEVGLLGGAIELIDRGGQVFGTITPPLNDSEIRSAMLRYNPFHPTVLMRTTVVLDAGGYRKVFMDADDYDTYLRISERIQLASLEEPLLQYRIHPNQVSIRNMRHQALCVLAARKAALLRGRGCADPLLEVQEITPQLLGTLGITQVEIQELLVTSYKYWIETLEKCYPEAAIKVSEEFLTLSDSGDVDRSVLSDVWLRTASVHYRQGRHVKALVSAGHALMVRPNLAGRAFKRMFTRLIIFFRGRQESPPSGKPARRQMLPK
jgi:glycosyltransferase involved in cell wall biosynthesis